MDSSVKDDLTGAAHDEAASLTSPEDLCAGRPEVRGHTIDAPWSRDLDDAVWVEREGGGWRAWVSIADVSAFVPPGSALDAFARRLMLTRYHAASNDPMLPRELSESRASLLPGRERPVVTVEVALDEALEPTSTLVYRARLTSARKLNYESAELAISDPRDPQHPQLAAAATLARGLLARRRGKGALVLYDLTAGWMTSEEGVLRKIPPAERHVSNIVIQELMILANSTVASAAAAAALPTVYRNHTARAEQVDRQALLARLDEVMAHPDEESLGIARREAITVFDRATYGTRVQGHFGLALDAYCHFTSPIRRYADLVAHRQVLAWLEGGDLPHGPDLEATVAEVNRVDAEVRAARRAPFKARAESRARGLAEAAGRLPHLEGDAFHRVVVVASREDGLTADLVAEVRARLDSGSLQVRDMLALLFESRGDSEEWRLVREAVVDGLWRKPAHAVSLLIMAAQQLGWSVPSYRATLDGEYVGVAATTVGGIDFVSGPHRAGKARQAQSLAAVDVVERVLGMPTRRALRPAWTPFPRRPDAKGRLQHFCATRRWWTPWYATNASGPPHAPTFTATVTVDARNGRELTAAGEGSTRREAEHAAAKALLDQLGVPLDGPLTA